MITELVAWKEGADADVVYNSTCKAQVGELDALTLASGLI